MKKIKSKRSSLINYFPLSILFFFLFYSCFKPEQNRIVIDPEPLNIILDSYVRNGIYPFLYSRIEDSNGSLLYEHSVVNRELLPDVDVDVDSWIRIWSMSKLITISIAMDLIEEGIISLEDSVINFIPEFKDLKVAVNDDGISFARLDSGIDSCPFYLEAMDSVLSIKNLFDHTAGFYYALTGFDCIDSLFADIDTPNKDNGDELINSLAKLPIMQHPGEIYKYGMNTTVLGLVLERATGVSLRDLLEERITEPFNIEGLRYTLPENVDLIPCHTGKDGFLRTTKTGDLDIFGKTVPDYNPDRNLFLGGEGMLSTAGGYISFMRLLFFHQSQSVKSLLTDQTIKEMTSKPTDAQNDDGYQTGYGFYLTSEKNPYEKNILRVGGYEGTTCWVDRKNKLIGTLFTQANSTSDMIGLGRELHNDFKKELYGQLNNGE